jgi:type III restriction enzyme
MGNAIRVLAQRMSLRKPQRESLEILERIVTTIDLKSKDSKEKKLDRILTAGLLPKLKDFDRDFPSFSFTIATGVGKTRLMGAFISYLFMEHGIRDFLVLAPNLTIYNKLIDDFRNIASPKYVFRGIGDFVHHQPRIITGDDYANVNTPRKQMFKPDGAQQSLFVEDLAINVFNISKLDKDASRIKSVNEYLGEAYFDYLKNLENLVVIMDESHRYRAEKGMQVINDLDPILGLELTATPIVSKGSKTIPFKNIAYEYPLANAIKDGYVKEPAVATRKNLDLKTLKKMDQRQLDIMKLEDSIVVHETTKTHLELYAKNNRLPRVKPFVLIVAQDTKHAEEILALIKSAKFYGGLYSDRVITVHSNLKGSERDENVQELLSLEQPENPIEIVIHVNMLKEGWDVTNLYTIVPLRAFAAEILTEQTLGRGLRLPYGKKTGDKEVDKLTVIAHDRFNEIIEAANRPDSIVMREYYIDPNDPEFTTGQEVITVIPQSEAGLEKIKVEIKNASTPESQSRAELKYALKKAIIDTVNDGHVLTKINSIADITSAISKKELKAAITKDLPLFNLTAKDRDEVVDQIFEDLIEETLQEIVTNTIEIPRIIVQPSGEVKTGFKDFKLVTKQFPRWQPVDMQILIKALQSGNQSTIGLTTDKGSLKDSNQDAIVRELVNHDEIDYDSHTPLLYSLASAAIDHISSYLNDSEKTSNVVQYYAKDIAKQIWIQMDENFYVKESGFETSEVKPFQRIERHNFSKLKTDDLVDFRVTFKTTGEMKTKVFKGFEKSCHSYYKFDVRPEKDFSVILEADTTVEKWLRPAHNQFKIFYNHQTRVYEPDFVVQTTNGIFLVEIKAKNEMDNDDVQDKAKSALAYCTRASQFTKENGGKSWTYLLIPDEAVKGNRDFNYFKAFEFHTKNQE